MEIPSLPFAKSNTRAEESINAPPVETKGMRVEVSEEMARLVVVACVPVAFWKVKFWRVVELLIRRLARVPVWAEKFCKVDELFAKKFVA